MKDLHRRLGVLALVGGSLGMVMCASEFDTTRRQTAETGTLGEEVFRVVCERVDVGENPADIDFAFARPFCTGTATAGGDGGGEPPANVGPKVIALSQRRGRIVSALDRALPASLNVENRLDTLLLNLLPLYGPDNADGGTVRLPDGGETPEQPDLLPQATRSVAGLLNGIAADAEARNALARISLHQGYRPPRVALGLTRSLLGYDQMGTVLDRTLALIREPGHPRGAGPAYPHWQTTLDVLRGELGAAAPVPAAELATGTTLDATMDLVFRSDPALGTGKERLLVRRDRFGMPRVATLGLTNEVPAPFVDTTPQDGIADSLNGRFLDRRRMPLTVTSPFPANEAPDGPRDMAGRALMTGTPAPMYDYVDLDQTVLAALLRDSRSLLAPATNTALRFAHGASMLLGPRVVGTRDYMLTHACPTEDDAAARCRVPPVRFQSFNSAASAPLVDSVHAAGIALTSRDIDPILQTFEALFTDHESVLARNTAALLALKASSDRYPEAVMDPRSNVWDDVVEIVRRIVLVPGLLEDIMAALADPRTAQLGRGYAAFARNRDRVEPTWTTAQQNNPPAITALRLPVDRSRPDTQNLAGGADDNRSAFQRMIHLIHDLNGVKLCNRERAYVRLNSLLHWPEPFTNPGSSSFTGYRKCELFQVDDAAVMYLHAIAGDARIQMNLGNGFLNYLASNLGGTVDDMLENNSGIRGFVTGSTAGRPLTPQGVNRFVFQPETLRTDFMRALLDAPRTRDGLAIREAHPGTIFVWELYSFYENMRPLVTAFTRHGDTSAHLFVELLSAVHLHWATNRAGQYQSTTPCTTRDSDGICTNGRLYSAMDGAVRYEPILADVFDGDFMTASGELMRILPMVNADTGRNGRDAIAALVRMLLNPAALTGVNYRDGRTTTVRSDGTTPVAQPSLYHLFADAMNGIDTAFATAPANRESWEFARSQMVDTFLSVDGGGTAGARFRNRSIPAVSRLSVRWVRDRIAAHRMVGDLDPWARGMASRFAATTSGPSFGAGLDMLLDVYDDIPARAAVGGLMAHVLDDSGTNADNTFGTSLTAIADLLQILRDDSDTDPLLHALAPAFQRRVQVPNGSFLREEAVAVGLRFFERARAYDTDHILDRALANMVSRPMTPLLADEPLVVLGDSIAETHRRLPGAGGTLEAEDIQQVFTQSAEFFTDQSRGMEQFYYIVQHRRF